MKRDLLISLIALLTLLSSSAALWHTLDAEAFELRGYEDATGTAALPYRVARLGVNADLTQYDPLALDQQLARMQQINIVWIRQFVRWNEIEPQKGLLNWQQWDVIAAALRKYPSLHLVAVLANTPQWARSTFNDLTSSAPPDNPVDLSTFARVFAERYGDLVDHYEIWDEPNIQIGWGGLQPRPAEYAALLAETYPAIHEADSEALIIVGGLAPTTEAGPLNINELDYLRALYAAGAGNYFDAVGAKPYGFNNSPLERTLRSDRLNFNRIILLREEMVRQGDARKSIWASAWGWNSLPDTWDGDPSIWGSVSPSQQIDFTLRALSRAEREWPWMGGMLLQSWQPTAVHTDPQWGFALIDQMNGIGPLWTALRDTTRQETATNGLFEATNPYTRYSGVWTFGTLGADIGWVQDSQFSFDFSGSDVSILVRQDDYVAYLYPTIDGGPSNATPQDSNGNAYIVLTSGSLTPETNLIPVAKGLTHGHHTLHVTADRGWDRWAIAGFGVSSGDLRASYNQTSRVAVVAIISSGIATLVSLRPLRRLKWGGVFSGVASLWALPLGIITSLSLMIGMLLTWGDTVPNLFRRDPLPYGIALLSAGLLQLQPGLVIALLAASILFIIFYHRPDIGLVLTMAWAPFFLFPVELFQFAFPVAEVLILITVLSRIMRGLVTLGYQYQARNSVYPTISLYFWTSPISKLDLWILAWLLIGCAAAFLWSDRKGPAATEFRVLFLEPVLFYVIFRSLSPNPSLIKKLVDAMLFSGAVVALIGLWQFAQGQAVITAEGGAWRLASVYGSPNNVALYLGRCIPFLMAFVLLPGDRRRRMIAAAVLIPIGLALILTQSVGGLFIGVPAGLTAVFFLVFGRKAWLPFIAVIILGILGFALVSQSPRFARALDFDSGTNFYRLRVWESALDVIRDHPVTGIGLDQFLYAFRGRYIRPDAWQEPNLSHPHNIILDFWVRTGIAGVVLLVAALLIFARSAVRLVNYRRSKRLLQPTMMAIWVGMIACVANTVAHGMIDNSIYVQDLSYIWVLLFVLEYGYSNMQAIDGS